MTDKDRIRFAEENKKVVAVGFSSGEVEDSFFLHSIIRAWSK